MVLKSKKAKIALAAGLGVAAVAVVGGGMLLSGGGAGAPAGDMADLPLTYAPAKEGSIASATLLSGTVAAAEEQYVYYDASKGDLQGVLVSQGDQVQPGQPLVQYDPKELQAAYDSAIRARDKVGRQIHELKTYGQVVTLTGDEATDNANVASTQRSVNSQLQDLNDAYADAQAQAEKAEAAIQSATVTSSVAGTVVEVNKSVSKSNTATSQTVVHIVNQGSLQVTGTLSEYDLANLAVEQEVKITSKVYPDKVWTGKISYISNYPEGAGAQAGAPAAGGSTAKYPFKVTINSEIGELKQGFNVNIEVVNKTKNVLVPVTAVVAEEDGSNYVWTIVDGKAKKVAVTLGGADAINQEITEGVKAGDHVIAEPNASLEDGKEVEAHEEITD